jgi:hypothetical protein
MSENVVAVQLLVLEQSLKIGRTSLLLHSGGTVTGLVTRRVLASLLVEHGLDHALQLVHGPYLHAQLFRLVQDGIATAALFQQGGIEGGLAVVELDGVDGAFGVRRGAGVDIGRDGTRRDDMGGFLGEEGDLALGRVSSMLVQQEQLYIPSPRPEPCS